MLNKKKISLFLVLILTGNLLLGCSPGGSEGKVMKLKVTEENPVAEADGISIEFSPYDINGDTEITVQKIKPADLFSEDILEDEVKVNTYDIKAPEIGEFTDLIEISLPYDDSFIEVGTPDKNVGVMYYDEELMEWTPASFVIDEKNKQVIITTRHLSIYSAFTIKNANSRTARIISVNSFPMLPPGSLDDFEEVIEEAMGSQMQPGQKATELGLGIAGDWMGISGSALTTITQTMYASEFAQGLGNAFANVGLAAAFVQAGHDFSKGDDTALFTNLTKNLSYYSVSKWGSNALQLSFVGVYAIDYSLNKFATAAWDGRKEIWYEAYKTYYMEENKRSYREWYTKLYWIWQDNKGSKDPNVLRDKTNEAIDSYTRAFWNLPEEDQAFWQSEVQKTGFSGGGGLSEALKNEISAAAKAELVKTLQETVFNRLERTVRADLTESYRKELIALKNYLNKVTNVLITENLKENEKSEYEGYTVRFAPLNDDAKKANWTGKIKEDGTVKTVFTALGHIQSGAPDTLLLFEPGSNPDTDEPVKTIPFKVSFPETRINLKEMIPTMDEIAGDWSQVYMKFLNIEMPEPSADSDEECELTDVILSTLKAARLSCKFEIVKIDEENADVIFGITSAVNEETGESLDIDPDPPVRASAAYKDGILALTAVIDEGSVMSISLTMKKNDEGDIVFDNNGRLDIDNGDGNSGKLEFNLKGKK
ncbi:MAG: hypothetical protein WBH44_01030 [Proteocatella sp.]